MTVEFWFMFPVAIVIATIAMSTGIGGAVFFSPIFLLVLQLDPTVAIGTALITELFGFASGLAAYLRQRLIDYRLGLEVLLFAVPAAVFGALIGEHIPDAILKAVFAAGIVFVGSQIFVAWYGERHESESGGEAPLRDGFAVHEVKDRSGRLFRFNVFNKPVAAVYSSVGGAFVGMISVGIAELMEYQMVAKCRIPPPVAVATAIFIVVITVAAASISHVVSFVSAGPATIEQVLSIAVFTAPGVLIGGQIGPFLQRVAPPSVMKVAISGVFIVVGIFMLASLAFAGG
jgi:hypothetical protein